MGIRLAQPSDLLFICASWRTSAEKPFLEGDACPWPHLVAVVEKCRKFQNVRMLRQIYNNEMRITIETAIQGQPTLVVYDTERPTFIIAWANKAYRYTKLPFRRQGIGGFLRDCLG
jgi:hypothetical protein